MSIFKKKTDHGYQANINVFFGDIDGRLNPNAYYQNCWDFKVMGAAYLKNAEIMLSYLLQQDPKNLDADTMIFPVFFNIWHGLELTLKSGNMLCDEFLGESGKRYTKHTIDIYADEFREKLQRLGFNNVDENYLDGMIEFVDECRSKNAHFDFARYSSQSNGDKQFYNQPDHRGIIPNLCVDMVELAKVLTKINYGTTRVVDFLHDYLALYGKNDLANLTDLALDLYTEHSSFTKFVEDLNGVSLEEIVAEVERRTIERQEAEKLAEENELVNEA